MRSLLIILIDLCIILGCIWAAFLVLGWMEWLTEFKYNWLAFKTIAPFIVVFYLFYMYVFGLYNSSRQTLSQVIYTVFLISAILMASIMAICFFVSYEALSFPRSVILLSACFYFVGLALWRTVVWKAAKKKHGVKDVCVIGDEDGALAQSLLAKHHDIFRISDACAGDDPAIRQMIDRADKVFVSAAVTTAMRERIIDWCIDQKKEVFFVPKYADISLMNSTLKKTDDIPTFVISQLELSLEERFVKRIFDLLLASLGFLVALPFGLIIAFFVKLDRGPVFYAQERLTRGGRVFKVYKFRTMVPNAEKLSGPVLAGEDDPRITRVGHIIRAIRMDELPQILNILKGDMSIVGPRPERPFFSEQFVEEMPEYRHRLTVKAGLTGLAQIMGKYNTSAAEKLRYDLIYINNYSLFQDLLIVLRTVKILFLKESTEGVETTANNPRQQNDHLTSEAVEL